jgi:hypothetical protein
VKLTIFGATGGVGRQLLDQAVDGHAVTAVVRNPDELSQPVPFVTADLASVDPARFRRALKGADAVLSALGPRSKSEADKLGFEVNTDERMDGFRWLTVSPPNQPDHELILLEPGPPMMDPETAEQVRELVAKGAIGPGAQLRQLVQHGAVECGQRTRVGRSAFARLRAHWSGRRTHPLRTRLRAWLPTADSSLLKIANGRSYVAASACAARRRSRVSCSGAPAAVSTT